MIVLEETGGGVSERVRGVGGVREEMMGRQQKGKALLGVGGGGWTRCLHEGGDKRDSQVPRCSSRSNR